MAGKGNGTSCPIVNIQRVFAQTIPVDILGHKLSLGLYFSNVFRLLGQTTQVDQASVERHVTKLKNRVKLRGPQAIKKHAVNLRYQDALELKDTQEILASINSPKSRFVHELFWPAVGDSLWAELKKTDSLGSKENVAALEKAISSSNGEERISCMHALAVVNHNTALAHEIDFIKGETEWNIDVWETALTSWSLLYDEEAYWEYLKKRIKSFKDFRLRESDVEDLRKLLPQAICHFNVVLSKAYYAAGRGDISKNHIVLISSEKRKEAIGVDILASLAQHLINADLRPLIEQAGEIQAKKEREDYSTLAPVLDRVLDQIAEIYHTNHDKLGIPKEAIETCEFDLLGDRIKSVVEESLDYKSDNRTRNILYALQVYKRLLNMPLSGRLKFEIERILKTNRTLLYDDNVPVPDELDPGMCWFFPGLPASPGDSIEEPFYKIVELNVKTCRWRTEKILIPRSTLARKFHDGESKKSIVKEFGEIFADDLKDVSEESRTLNEERTNLLQPIEAVYDKDRNEIIARRDKEIEDTKGENKEEYDAASRKIKALRKQKEAKSDERAKLEEQSGKPALLKAGIALSWLFSFAAALLLYTKHFGDAVSFIIPRGFIIDLIQTYMSTDTMSIVVGAIALIPLVSLLTFSRIQTQKLKKKINAIVVEIGENEELERKTKKKVKTLQDSIDKIKRSYKQKLDSLKSKFRSKKKRLVRDIDDRLKVLNELLEPTFKPESDWNKFPAVVSAKKNGMESGDKPSDYYIEREQKRIFERIRDGLSYSEAEMLQSIFSKNEDMGMAILVYLSENPGASVYSAMTSLLGQ